MGELLLQTAWWGRIKSRFGWEVISGGTPTEGPGLPLVLQRRIGPFRLAYVPHGYGSPLDFSTKRTPAEYGKRVQQALRDFDALARPAARAAGPHLIRWDVPWETDVFPRDVALAAGLVPAPTRVQPPDTVLLDLDHDQEQLLAQMKTKTRYNIRLARRRGVEVTRYRPGEEGTQEALSAWYRMYRQTAVRDGITIHQERYYRQVLAEDTGAASGHHPDREAPRVQLYLATHERDQLGGLIVASWNGVSTYMYGAGSDLKRNLMASYLLQWEAIVDARANGDRWYDFFGIPPSDDPTHPMHGLYRFKTGFGGRIVHRPGCWDYPVSRGAARVYRGVERSRTWYYQKLRKRLLR